MMRLSSGQWSDHDEDEPSSFSKDFYTQADSDESHEADSEDYETVTEDDDFDQRDKVEDSEETECDADTEDEAGGRAKNGVARGRKNIVAKLSFEGGNEEVPSFNSGGGRARKEVARPPKNAARVEKAAARPTKSAAAKLSCEGGNEKALGLSSSGNNKKDGSTWNRKSRRNPTWKKRAGENEKKKAGKEEEEEDFELRDGKGGSDSTTTLVAIEHAKKSQRVPSKRTKQEITSHQFQVSPRTPLSFILRVTS